MIHEYSSQSLRPGSSRHDSKYMSCVYALDAQHSLTPACLDTAQHALCLTSWARPQAVPAESSSAQKNRQQKHIVRHAGECAASLQQCVSCPGRSLPVRRASGQSWHCSLCYPDTNRYEKLGVAVLNASVPKSIYLLVLQTRLTW